MFSQGFPFLGSRLACLEQIPGTRAHAWERKFTTSHNTSVGTPLRRPSVPYIPLASVLIKQSNTRDHGLIARASAQVPCVLEVE